MSDTTKNLLEMKKELKELLLGKFMIRKDRSYKGDEARGIYTWRLYYDTPTAINKATIMRAFETYGFECSQDTSRVIGGTYGYTFMFRSKA